MFYHIRIDYYDTKLKVNQTLFDFDNPTVEEVVSKVTEPYLREQKFFFKGVRLSIEDIRKVGIYRSERDIESCREVANSQIPRNVIMVYGKEHILPYKNLVTDITDEVIKQTEYYIYSMDNPDTFKQQVINASKTPMVFISHSSKDKRFVEALVDLFESLGFTPDTLFCSSVDGYGIPLSNDIFETLRDLFSKHNLYVIFIHSPRYYDSPVSLNEMGAAWVLKTDFCSLLTNDMQFDKMKGVVNGSSISIKVDADDAPARLTELKDLLTKKFSLPVMDSTKWERKRNGFLDIVKAINIQKA